MACACDDIIVLSKSSFSPVSPLLGGIDTYTLLKTPLLLHLMAYLKNKEYKTAFSFNPYQKAKQTEKATTILVQYVLNKYAIKEPNIIIKWFKVRKIIRSLVNFKTYYSHDTSLSPLEQEEMGLNIKYAENEEMNLIEEFDFLSREFLSRTNAVKIFINSEKRFIIGK